MSKEDLVKEGMDKLQQVLGDLVDKAQAEAGQQPAPEDTTPYDQAHVDAEVAKATEALNKHIADMELADKDEKTLIEKIAEQLKGLVQAVAPAQDKKEPLPSDIGAV